MPLTVSGYFRKIKNYILKIMKKALIIALLNGFSLSIFSQTQYKLPIESGTWKVEYVICTMKGTIL